MTMWSVEDSRQLAEEHVSSMGARWAHLTQVGRTAERLAEGSSVPPAVVCAAWLHDIGYAPTIAQSGFHPLDGARFLRSVHVPEEIVSLVAFHTGAKEEAAERGLTGDLAAFLPADPRSLDLLTMIDLATGPDGSPILDLDRISEILTRYAPDHPVHSAVSRSANGLLASSARGKALLGLTDDWPLTTV